MGGEITVDSEYGKGSTFKIILPQKIMGNVKIAAVKAPEEKNVLVYERREVNINSIIKTLDNLGIKSKLVSTISDFFDSIESKKYSYVLLPSILYDEVNKKGYTFEPDINIAVIVDFGEAITARNISVLSMPIYSIPIANFLNGFSDSNTGSSRMEDMAKFTAPEAKILIVDDIQTNLEVVEGLLLPYKMQLTLCTNGKEAIEKIKSTRYDLVFMDRMMPEMDGVETVAHIRALGDKEPYYKKVPIAALTADAVFGTKELLLQKGFDDFLSKPIDVNIMSAILEKWIPKEKQRDTTESAEADEQDKAIEIKIEGLDTEKGLAMAGWKIDRYKKILTLFYKDGLEKIKEIQTCLETGNTSLYTIYVHALKSATAIVGSDKLSETAKSLEAAGKQGDLAFIHAYNGAFITDLEELFLNINAFLSEEAKKGQKIVIDKELLKEELSRLKTALINFDIAETNKAVNFLQELTLAPDIGNSINTILQNKLIGEHDEAVSQIETLLQELDKQ
jgi:CheY-like chemotaxis protein